MSNVLLFAQLDQVDLLRWGSCRGATVLIGFGLDSARKVDVAAEVFKAGVQLAAVVLAGAGITYVLGRAELLRQAQRWKAEDQTRVLSQIMTAYNDVKAVRRTLRADGFRSGGSSGLLTREQSEEFAVRMRQLVESQLAFEQIEHELDEQGKLTFGEQQAELRGAVKKIGEYLKEVTEEWEGTAGAIRANASIDAIHSLPHLQALLSPAREGGFKQQVGEPLRAIRDKIRAARLSGG